MMQETRDYFSGATITDGTAAIYADEWIELVSKFGIDRFEPGLKLARRYRYADDGQKRARLFFPLPSEIAEVVERETVPKVKTEIKEGCPDCAGTGWMQKDPNNRDVGVMHCRCRKVVQIG